MHASRLGSGDEPFAVEHRCHRSPSEPVSGDPAMRSILHSGTSSVRCIVMRSMKFARVPILVVAAVIAGSSAASADSPGSAQRSATRVLHLTHAPYAGVRCPGGNSIACDRISLAVWPAGQPQRLTASIAGRRITMEPPPPGSGRAYWEGTLDHAGLLTPGPLFVIPDRGRFYWAGRHPRAFSLDLSASYSGRISAEARVRTMLHPGWG
jgi:hypothetical protein